MTSTRFTDRHFLDEKPVEDLVRQFLHKAVECIGAESTPTRGDEEETSRLGELAEFTDRRFTLRLPTGLLLRYRPSREDVVFAPIERHFLEACVQVLGSACYLLESTPRGDLRGRLHSASAFHTLLRPRDQILQRYLMKALASAHSDLTAVSSRAAIWRFLDLLEEMQQASVEGVPVRTALAFFRDSESAVAGSAASTRLDEPPVLGGYSSLKPLVPVADGEVGAILVGGDRILGVGYRPHPGWGAVVPDDFEDRRCPLVVRFRGSGKVEVRAVVDGHATTVVALVEGRPVIRDETAVLSTIARRILELLPDKPRSDVERLCRLFLRMARFDHGATFLIGDAFPDLVRVLACRTDGFEQRVVEGHGDDALGDLLLHHGFTDGAVLLDRELRLRGLGAILPVDRVESTADLGARHTSALSYTRRVRDVVAVVASQDGPISIVSEGRILVTV